MQSLSQCGHFCNGQQPNHKEPAFGAAVSTLQPPPPRTSQLFAQTNIHDVPSDKLNELSAKYREEAYYDLHGVSTTSVVEENPDFVAEKLQELDQQMFLVEQRTAFEMAMEANPNYVQGLRLRFLRAESYDVPRAAHRFALNFEFRLDMFGPHVLGRDILYSDLPEVDKSLLDTGYMQVTRGRDRAGRSICVQIMRRLGQEPPPDSAVSYLPSDIASFPRIPQPYYDCSTGTSFFLLYAIHGESRVLPKEGRPLLRVHGRDQGRTALGDQPTSEDATLSSCHGFHAGTIERTPCLL